MARVVMKGLACACLVVFISAVYFRRQKGKAKTTPVSSQVRGHDCTTHIHYLPHEGSGLSRYRTERGDKLHFELGLLPVGYTCSHGHVTRQKYLWKQCNSKGIQPSVRLMQDRIGS